MKKNLEDLNALLKEAAEKLDEAASVIRDINLDKEKNMYKVGEALTNIYEIQNEIFELCPELKPKYLDG
ncbi:MAG: hypothetical protein PVG66_03335 [Chromatiales bacterium]|jgi:hypothetical protein